MNAVHQKVSLDQFLATADGDNTVPVRAALESVHARLQSLRPSLNREPQIMAQVDKLADELPIALAGAGFNDRQRAARVARDLTGDLKARWIAAPDPPLVSEIDDHLFALAADYDVLETPDQSELRAIASKIDRLSAAHAELDGIEWRYLPWAAVGLIFFLLGLLVFILPTLIPGLSGFIPTLVLLGFLPALAIHYTIRVRPRSNADGEIEALNRAHFLPRGGLYFPASDQPAGVVLVDWTPPESDAQRPKDPRKEKDPQDPNW